MQSVNVRFLGHASFILKSSVTVAIDPFDISFNEKADYIFITHSHYDHCSQEDIKKISNYDKTVIICTRDCRDKLKKLAKKVITVEPSKTYDTGIRFKTIPAYNIIKPFHPKSNNWVGYFIYLGQSVYHTGDTDFVPEMKDLKPDILLIPIGGTYTMDASEAAEAAKDISPGKAIPMHYGKIIGSREDAETFKNLCSIPVEILKPEG
ncbi:MAG: MBL fold metallo-hydrolase [Spirochaetes bacterium]|nr:MAG: MBL fold metallo-hydrolase [Spirochaetota bacterium]